MIYECNRICLKVSAMSVRLNTTSSTLTGNEIPLLFRISFPALVVSISEFKRYDFDVFVRHVARQLNCANYVE